MAIEPRIIDNGQGVKIIDPNPPHQVVEHEDLYIYASLVAKTKGRSFITEGTNGGTTQDNINISTVDMVISDTATDNGKKRQFLTTAWSDIGGSQIDDAGTRGDVEGFGITNIDIEIKGSYIPRVVVDFVDIRGATLFEQGSCSPYGMFFHLPYPIFELTLKGYYGKPATYFLNLQKFNTKFNTETGNFECKAEFIGWSYAFLADMLMGYVRCANYMKGPWAAKDSLRKKYDEAVTYYLDNGIFDESDYSALHDNVNIRGGKYSEKIQPFCRKIAGTDTVECKTITSLLQDIQQIKTFLGQVKADDNYLEVANLIRTKNEVIKMRQSVTDFARKLEQDFKGYLDGDPRITKAKNPNKSARNIKELYVFNQAPDDKLKGFLATYWGRPIDDGSGGDLAGSGFGEITSNIPTIKEGLVKENFNTGQKTCGGSHVAVASNKTFSDGLTQCEKVSEEPFKYQLLDFLDDIKGFQKGMLKFNDKNGNLQYEDTKNSLNNDFYIDVGYLTSLLDGDLATLSEEIERKRNSVKEAIDDGVTRALGFRPTIRNIFTILSCNVENFVQLLLNVSIKAEEHHKELEEQYNEQYHGGAEEQLMVLNRQGPGDAPKKIYPWPTYYKTNYRSTASYNSNSKTETKEVYPGVNSEFNSWPEVRFVEDFIDACTRLNEADEDLLEDKESRPGYDNYMPINPLESQIYGQIQLKYRELIKSLDTPSSLKDGINKIIAERMFITLDFSYFDPIRYNQFNLGLGFNYPWRKQTKGNSESIDFPTFQQNRIWFPTLYKATTSELAEENPIIALAKIDAHNLMSCITDTDKLQTLNLQIFQNTNSLFDQIEEQLKQETDNKTEPTGDTNKPWFNPDAKYTDLSTNISIPNASGPDILKQNLITNQEWVGGNGKPYTEDYWAYYPREGYIRLLGVATPGGIGKAGLNQQEVHCDIRKMKPEYLFQLIDGETFEAKLDAGVDMGGYINDTNKKREELQGKLAKAIVYTGLDNNSSKTEMNNYTVEDSNSKLVTFNGDDTNKGLRLFTTLSITPKQAGDFKPFNIEYVGPMLTPSSDDSGKASRITPGWGSIKQTLIPFMQQVYMWQGVDGGHTGEEYNREAGTTQDASYPWLSLPFDPPATGIFKGAELGQDDKGGSEVFKCKSTYSGSNPAAKMGDISDDICSTEEKTRWGWIQVIDTLIQNPLWLDNTLKFREAASDTNAIDTTTANISNRVSNADWGYKRPLTKTDGDTNYYGLKGPKLEEIKQKYGNAVGLEYSSTEIQNRNLAYLFLSACKTTPFITCGSSEANKNTGDGGVEWINPAQFEWIDDPGDGIFNYKGDHYPKALRPFITSQGLVKIPKVWVYGMGAVMWRWKMYMGANKDTSGNIRWRHPAFGETPNGLDPLSQPGHPGIATEDRDETPIRGYLIGPDFFTGRKDRSRTEDGGSGSGGSFPGESYANKLFKDEKGLWTTSITQQERTQVSAFSRGVTRVDGITRATFHAASTTSEYTFLYNGTQDPPQVDGWSDTITFGCMFDYWGVYNLDKLLNRVLPNDWKPKLSNNYVGAGAQKQQSFGAWTSLAKNFMLDKEYGPDFGTEIWVGDNSLGTRLSENFNELDGDSDARREGNPLELQMRSAHEATANSFWPNLWCAPWQHFYTEPVNIGNTAGASQADTDNDNPNDFVEQTLTILPYDIIFRDYVGNFGYLGNQNGNYAAIKLDADPVTITADIPESFTSITKGVIAPTTTALMTSFTIKYDIYGEAYLMSAEGGKYAELMALLPTFVKDSFVKEFEDWCDNEWKDYLPVIDPVNFEEGGKKSSSPNYGGKYGKLSDSYRAKQFKETQPLDKLLGTYHAENFYGSNGDVQETFFAIPTLSKEFTGDNNPKNINKVKELEDILVREFYYAVIPTPRLFGLDVWNGDESEEVNGMSKNAFYANKDLAKQYLKAFKSEWDSSYLDKRGELTLDPTKNDDGSVLNDDDIKLSLYRSFKSITDKWISSSTNVKENTPSYFFNITDSEVVDKAMGTNHVPLAGHFSYVNRAMQEIGNKSVLDVIKLDKIPQNPKMSFYNLISDLLGENNFDFFPLPTYTNFTADKSNENLKSMFRPDTNSIVKASGPNFICMYVGGTSRTLDLKSKGSKNNCPADNQDMSYNDDGISLTEGKPNSLPQPTEMQSPEDDVLKSTRDRILKDGKDSQLSPGRIEGQGFTAFRVAYGVENQNMFKSVELDQSEFSETNESLLVINRLANGGNPGDKTNKGQNLHNLYLTRSYSCTVQSMGNMMIQPLQYFELTNIPMFYGTYLITEVKHNVKPHHIGTTFKGVRQPLATVPIVEDIATAMSLSLRDIDPIAGGNIINSGSGGGGSYATSSINVSNVSASNGFYVQQSDGDLYVVSDRLGVAGATLLEFTRDLEKYLQNKFPDREYKFSNDNGAGPNITRSLQDTLAGGRGRIKTSKHGSGFAIDLLFEGKFKNIDSGDISELGNYYNTPSKKDGGTDTRTGYKWPKGNLVVVKDHDYMNAIKEYLETSKWKDIIKWGATWGGDYTDSGREKIPGIENSTLNFNDGATQNDELHHFEIKSGIMAKYWTQEQKDFIESIGLKVPNKQSELAPIYKYPFDNPSVLTDDTFQDKGDGEPSSNVVPVPSNFDDTQPIGKGIEGKNITSAGSVQNALQYAGQI